MSALREQLRNHVRSQAQANGVTVFAGMQMLAVWDNNAMLRVYDTNTVNFHFSVPFLNGVNINYSFPFTL